MNTDKTKMTLLEFFITFLITGKNKCIRNLCICACLFLLNTAPALANTQANALAIYAGPSSTSALVDIIRLREFELTTDFIIAAAFDRRLTPSNNDFAIEAELSIAKHLESANRFAFSAGIGVRWLRTPWERLLRSSFAFVNGLSYAVGGVPEVETRQLTRTNPLLYHLALEFAFPVIETGEWETLFRIHHRSGAFGLFNHVVGGSDFLCLGIRRKF